MCFIKISDAAILFNGFAVNFPLYPSGTILAKLKVSGITVESANQLENVVFKRKHKIRVDSNLIYMKLKSKNLYYLGLV